MNPFIIGDFNLSGSGTYTLNAENSDIIFSFSGENSGVFAEPNADLVFEIKNFQSVVFSGSGVFTLDNATLNINSKTLIEGYGGVNAKNSKININGDFTIYNGGNYFNVSNSQVNIKGNVTNYGKFLNGSETCKYDKVTLDRYCKDEPANVTINGDFYNKGDNYYNKLHIDNNSVVDIEGSIYSQPYSRLSQNLTTNIFIGNGLLRVRKSVYNKEFSTIAILGKGVLRAEQGLYNQKGSTLIFYLTKKSDDSWDMEIGRLEGDLFNEGGEVKIEPYSGYYIFNVGDSFQFITGKITGLTEISFNRGQAWAIGATCHNGVLTIVDGKSLSGSVLTIPCTYDDNPTPQPPQPEPTNPNQTNTAQNPNYDTIKSALEDKLFGMSASEINQAANDTDKTLQTSVIAQPKNMMKAFKADTLSTPLNSAYVSRLTASSGAIMNDSSNFINPLERASETEFFASPFGGVLKGDNLNGTLFGMSIGLTHIDDDYIVQGHFSYAQGKSTQDLSTQSTELNANLFQVGGFARLFFYDKLETDFNANFIFGKFELNNVWFDNALLNSSSNFNNYQANVGATLGWRFGDEFSIKPFAGVQGYYENQGEFKQDGGLELTSKAYSSMIMDALVGLETRYIFDNGSFIFAKASYENKLYNSHKEVFMRIANENLKYENESYNNVINANLGARVLATKSFKLDIEALYKRYDSGLNYFGGNLGVKFSF